MKKNEILAELNQIQIELNMQRTKLEEILSTPIWSEIVYDEMDDTVRLKNELSKQIDQLVVIQKRIFLKPNK